MSELGPIQQAVLDRIASGEAHSYNEVFGGHRFQGYSDHPKIEVKLPQGGYTSAAGRYQMTTPTWQAQKKRLGLADFSPASQDTAALDLAQQTYQQKTGRDLISDTAAGRTDWSALGSQWTSLRPKAPSPSMTAALLPSNPLALSSSTIKPVVGLGTPSFTMAARLSPNLGSELDPSTALSALRAAAPGVSLEPVDYHPWGPGPSLTPVSHNPFQTQEASNAQ